MKRHYFIGSGEQFDGNNLFAELIGQTNGDAFVNLIVTQGAGQLQSAINAMNLKVTAAADYADMEMQFWSSADFREAMAVLNGWDVNWESGEGP